MIFKDFSIGEINAVMRAAWEAFHLYRKLPLKARADFMRSIAAELENCGDALVETAMAETHLPEARLKAEKARTIFQLNQYADACQSGTWLEARIDTAIPDKNPPKPDLRKMLIPLGPVVVFGASNFPLAYSTAGGDTACALAAGCPVIVKAHPAHTQTSHLTAHAIAKAVSQNNLPKGVFSHVYGQSIEVGEALVKHPQTKAVGFTGSYTGGKQLFDWANQRREPIPVFAEMGSTNPVFLLPEKLKSSAAEIATMYAASITLGVGQFCTKPGLLIGVDGEDLKIFVQHLSEAIRKCKPGAMLHTGIAMAYHEKKERALKQKGVQSVVKSDLPAGPENGRPTIATTSGEEFLKNEFLKQEIFGPYSLLIKCKDREEMLTVARSLDGQLTSTLMATDNDIATHEELVEAVKNICGRFILNSVPTGVEVCLSMQHGGPFPATTDARFTSVGADGIKRFARPIAFQNWSNNLLPPELKNENPSGIWRTVNNELSKSAI